MSCQHELSRARALAVAQAVLLGRLDVVRAAWALSGLRHDIDGADADADFLLMAGVASETDHLPLDPVRHRWALEALAPKDAELAEAAAH